MTQLKGHWIYNHRDPEGNIVYIGRGSSYCGNRSRDTTRTIEDHSRLLKEGALSINIVVHGLEYHECKKMELELIKHINPIYNTQGRTQ